MTPPGDADRAGRLRDLATTLRQVHETTGDLGARDEAVRLDAEAEATAAAAG